MYLQTLLLVFSPSAPAKPGRRLRSIDLREGFKKKKKKKSGNFPTEGGGAFRFWLFFPLFLFIFKHGLNHPEMQKKNLFTPW